MAYPRPTRRPWRAAALALLAASAAACGRDPVEPGPSPSTIVDLTISPDSAVIGIGEKVRFTAVALTDQGPVSSSVTWTADHPDVASVSDDGLVTGVAGGETRISATAGSVTRSRTVRVRYPVFSLLVCGSPISSSSAPQVTLALCPDSIDVPPGWQAPLIAFGVTAGGDSTSAIGPVTWQVEDTTIATVGPGLSNGLWAVAGRRPGTTTIQVSADGLTGQAVVTVRPRPAHVTVAVRTTPPTQVVIESWAFDEPVAETIVGGQFPMQTPNGLDLMFAGLEWSPDGRELLYSSAADELSVLAPDRSSVWTFSAPDDGVYTPAWEPDGTIVFSTRTGELRRIQRQGVPLYLTPPALDEAAWYVRPRADGRLVYGCQMENPFYPYSDSSVCLRDGQARRVLEACGTNPDVSPDGTTVASVCGVVTLTPTAPGPSKTLSLPGRPAFGVRWAPDGRSLAVVTWSGSLWVVDADGTGPIYRFPPSGAAVAVAWQP